MNGGKKEDFEEMNADDVQLIYTTYTAYQNATICKFTEAITKLFGGS